MTGEKYKLDRWVPEKEGNRLNVTSYAEGS